MAFTWKDKKDIWKGEGVYFLTFVVRNRVDMLGSLQPLCSPDKDGHIARVDTTELGNAVYREFNALQSRYPGFSVVAKQVMPNHFHAVCWCKGEFGDLSIKMVARGFAQACSRVAREMYRLRLDRSATDGTRGTDGPSSTGGTDGQDGRGGAAGENEELAVPSIESQSDCDKQYACGNGANTLFEPPFIRTLSHKGQLQSMIRYVHANPDNAWRRRMNPSLYVIRRSQRHGGLLFDTMGKGRLVEYPDRNVVALSRSLTEEQIAEEVRKALRLAESGAVTYCAAINEGEKAVTKAVREAGYPLVVMMLDGFPPEGTEAARFFHPGGVYHRMCGEGRLYLMAPLPQNYDNAEVIARTEQELRRKAEAKRQVYVPLPHDSKRWRMIAGNVMMGMIGNG